MKIRDTEEKTRLRREEGPSGCRGERRRRRSRGETTTMEAGVRDG